MPAQPNRPTHLAKCDYRVVMHPSSARFSSDSARAGEFSARLGSARDIFEPARLAKIGHMRAKISSVQAMKKNRLGPKLQTLSLL